MTRLLRIFLFSSFITVALSSCVSMPSSGEHAVMVVNSIPHKRQQLQASPGLSLGIERGLAREAVKAGRVMVAGCATKRMDSHLLTHSHGYVLLPEGVKVKDYSIIEVAAEEADDTGGPYARFYARYLGKVNTKPEDFVPDKYSIGDRAFLCGPVDPDGRTRVQAYFPAKWWDYDYTVAEAARNRQITDEELKAGRIALTECSVGVDSWASWKVRIPEGMSLTRGDYIEAIAGVAEGFHTGPLTRAMRKVAKPPKEDFILTQGQYTVGCDARAVPLKE